MDSLVNVVEQIRSQDEPDLISHDSSIKTDETSSMQLPSERILTQDIEDVAEKQSSTPSSLADIINQTNNFQSPIEQEKIITHTQEFIEPIIKEEKLDSVDSTIETNRYFITPDDAQQKPASSTLSTTDKTLEKTISSDDQSSSIELEPKQETSQQESIDSLVDIVRQIPPVLQDIRLPSTDTKIETTHAFQQVVEKPSADSHVEIVPTRESIPSELLVTNEAFIEKMHDNQEIFPKLNEIASVTEHELEAKKEDEAQSLSTDALTEAMRDILETSLTFSQQLDHSFTETTDSTTEQEDQKSPIIQT